MSAFRSGLPRGLTGAAQPPAKAALLAETTRPGWCWLAVSCLVTCWSLASVPAVLAQAAPVGTFDSRPLLGPEGEPLSFADEEDLVRLLATAEQRSVKLLSRGITGAKRLTLEQGGVRVRVIFHDIDRSERRPKRLPNGRTVMYLRDSYKSQVAAYRVSRLLGMRNVPPTVLRVSGAAPGSAQLWIEDAITEDVRIRDGIELTDYNLWNQIQADMRVFDNLINNIDRNQGNLLVDSFGNFWLIDHTRSFGQDSALPMPETITRCSKRMLEAIRSLDEETLKEDLEPYLTHGELKALWQRRRKVLDQIESKVSSLGGTRVLFDYGDPDPGVSILYDNASASRQ